MNTNNEYNLTKADATKPVYSITPFTLLDYPHKTACILWFAGCNMKCVYCYNPDIVFGKGKISISEVLNFLNRRKSLLDGVVLSGGECTSHKNIRQLLQEIKKLGFLVKIDTNGSNPEKLINLINENLVDYVALDFKSTKEKFNEITKSNLFSEFEKTLNYLVKSKFPFEVRTTVHSELLNLEDLQSMTEKLENSGYRGKYYLQYYLNDVMSIGNISNTKRNYINTESIQTKLEVVIRN
ncbi:MAG: anaerobic ribonucleoside-triphosphate reductase activating protein [Bacteroidetes bacterium]|nr:anaerobic ribonucleoside-triphosphate reductase activating protein [Bacteroidota bacterium]